MSKDVKRILVAGEGGQGVQLICHVLAKAAFNSGLHVAYMPNYGVEQRGGVSIGYLQIGKGEISFPKFAKADFLVVMCERAVERVNQYIGDNSLYIYDSGQINSRSLSKVFVEKLHIPATEIASQRLTPKVANMVLAGALTAELRELKIGDLETALEELLADKYKKKAELRHLNKKALEFGVRLAKEAYKVEA